MSCRRMLTSATLSEFIDEPEPLSNAAGPKRLGEVVRVGVASTIANAIHRATGKRIWHISFRIKELFEGDRP